MKVKELIEELKKYDPEMEVYYDKYLVTRVENLLHTENWMQRDVALIVTEKADNADDTPFQWLGPRE